MSKSSKKAAAAAALVAPVAVAMPVDVSPLTVQLFIDASKVQLRIASAMAFELNARRLADNKFKTVDYVRQVVPALAAAGHYVSEKTVANYAALSNKFCERYTAQLISFGDLSEENVGLFAAFVTEQAKGFTASIDDLSNFMSGRPSIAAQAAQAAADKAAAEQAIEAKKAKDAEAAAASAEQAAAAQAELLKAEQAKAAEAEQAKVKAEEEAAVLKAEAAEQAKALAAAKAEVEAETAAAAKAAEAAAAEAALAKQAVQISFSLNKKGEKEMFVQDNISLAYLQECIALLMDKAEELQAAAAAATAAKAAIVSVDVSANMQQPIGKAKGKSKGKAAVAA